MEGEAIQWVFWGMVAFFIISIASIFIIVPIIRRTNRDSPLRFSPFATLSILIGLGVALLILTITKQEPGLLKKFLLLSGSSAIGLLVFAVLHNLVTALLVKFFKFAKDFDEPVFFITAIMVCPLGFLVGSIGTIVLST